MGLTQLVGDPPPLIDGIVGGLLGSVAPPGRRDAASFGWIRERVAGRVEYVARVRRSRLPASCPTGRERSANAGNPYFAAGRSVVCTDAAPRAYPRQ